jgi:hypothetical protein
MIKLITDRPAMVADEVRKRSSVIFASLPDIKKDEVYISFLGRWAVYRMDRDRIPRLCGHFPDIQSAMFRVNRR